MGMVIIVPAFPEGQQRHKPVVCGHIAGGETPGTPHVCGRVDEPGGV
jgi:hypothetical protein